jgi:hypothetical protein
MRKPVLAMPLIVLTLVMGCASFKENGFLVQNLDDSNKATALTNQGIIAYNSQLIDMADYKKVGMVREYFVVALHFDPANPKARQYLEKVDNFKNALKVDKLHVAEKLLAHPDRKEEENYILIVALQTAAALEPSDVSTAKLLRDIAPIQASLVKIYLARSEEAQTKAVNPVAKDSVRETLYLEAYAEASKASKIAPSDVQAVKQKAVIKAELEKAYKKHATAVAKLVSQSKFEDAKAELGRASALNSKLGRPHGPEISAATYSLYFRWAKSLAAKGSNQDADDKLDIAISAKNSDEATALKKRLAGQAGGGDGASFDALLPDIDRLIAKGDLLGANKRMVVAARLTTDRSKLGLLDPRRKKIAASLDELYEKGVAAYRAEDFKSAIDQLSIVAAVDADYQQTSDYLDKAKEKQKLIDQFSN